MPATASAKPAVAAIARPATDETAKAVLSEDKLLRFAIYLKEMLAVTADSMNMGMQAFAKAGTDQKRMEAEMVADRRVAHVAEVNKVALEKSGLSQSEIPALTRVTGEYYAKVFALQGAIKKLAEHRKNIEEANAKGKAPSILDSTMVRVYAGQVAGLESVRSEFSTKHGADALALVRKHEPEFLAINEKLMAAATGAMKK